MEIPISLYNKLPKALRAEGARIEADRIKRLERQAEVLRLLAEGWKVSAVAHHLGLDDSQVYRIKYAGKPGGRTLGTRKPSVLTGTQGDCDTVPELLGDVYGPSHGDESPPA